MRTNSPLLRAQGHGMMGPAHVERVYILRMTNTEPAESQQQPYDRALKSLMEDHAAEMVPELVPETRVIAEQNNEITRLNLRADIVYLIEYNGELRILNMELQTEAEKNMAFRMLVYHLELYDKYELPRHLRRALPV